MEMNGPTNQYVISSEPESGLLRPHTATAVERLSDVVDGRSKENGRIARCRRLGGADLQLRGYPYLQQCAPAMMPQSNLPLISYPYQSIIHAIYHLAANPEYMQPMREEIEAVIKEQGWSKVAVGKMWKLDSFLRESQRINGIVSSESVFHRDHS